VKTHIAFIKAWFCTLETTVAILLLLPWFRWCRIGSNKCLYRIAPSIEEEMPLICLKTQVSVSPICMASASELVLQHLIKCPLIVAIKFSCLLRRVCHSAFHIYHRKLCGTISAYYKPLTINRTKVFVATGPDTVITSQYLLNTSSRSVVFIGKQATRRQILNRHRFGTLLA